MILNSLLGNVDLKCLQESLNQSLLWDWGSSKGHPGEKAQASNLFRSRPEGVTHTGAVTKGATSDRTDLRQRPLWDQT